MRIATWNLVRPRPTSSRTASLLDHMRPIAADIWVLTETLTDLSPGPNDFRAAYSPLFLQTGGQFIVYGTVLPWLGDKSQAPLKGADAFLATLSVQREDWGRIRASSPDTPLCVAGDFNQDLLPTGHYYGSARGRAALRAALQGHGLACLTGESRDPIARKYDRRACIDHICLAGLPGIEGRSGAPHLQADCWLCETSLGSTLSDHFGLVIDLP